MTFSYFQLAVTIVLMIEIVLLPFIFRRWARAYVAANLAKARLDGMLQLRRAMEEGAAAAALACAPTEGSA